MAEGDGITKKFWYDEDGDLYVGKTVIAVFLAIGIFVGICMIVFPQYGVWSKGLAGKAQLREAEWNRQIAVKEAEAKMEAAVALAAAEVERARGVAEANDIIASTISEPYLRYLWIQGLHDGSSEVIYVATEANLPILEASRLEIK